MTDIEIRVAIAKTQGYRIEEIHNDSAYGHCFRVTKPDQKVSEVHFPEFLGMGVPLYTEIRDDIDQVIEQLPPDELSEFLGQLADLVGEKWTDSVIRCPKTFKATAYQRCLAFLRTKKLETKTTPPCQTQLPAPPSRSKTPSP